MPEILLFPSPRNSHHDESIVESLAPHVRPYGLFGIAASDRDTPSRELASGLADRLGIRYTDIEGSEEVRLPSGDWSDPARVRRLLWDFFRKPAEGILPDESGNEAARRFHHALETAVEIHPVATFGLVTGPIMLSHFLARHSDLTGLAIYERLNPPCFARVNIETFRLEELITPGSTE